jgi:hypothetical protein
VEGPWGKLEELCRDLNLVLGPILFIRLLAGGLLSRYKALGFCLAFSFTRGLVLAFIDRQSSAYGYTYLCTAPILQAADFAVVLEIYGQVLRQYRGLSFLGRGTLVLAMAGSAAAALVGNWMELDFSREPYVLLRLVFLLETTVAKMLLVFLLLLAAFLIYYPVSLRRNLLIYTFGFTATLAAVSLGILLRNLDPAKVVMASALRMAVYSATLAVWLACFRRSWETEVSSSPVPYTPEQGRRLLGQLDAMNTYLERKKGAIPR